MPQSRWRPWDAAPAVLLLLGLAACALAYTGGVRGPFLLDDAPVLSDLGSRGVSTTRDAIAFAFGGEFQPLARPVAMASFLLSATAWPADPAPLKWHNVIVHLCNALLLALLGFRLARLQGLSARVAAWGAVGGALAWAAHPLWVSSVLYVVQRMALLATFFVLAGLLLHVLGREALAAGHARRGFTALTGGAAGCLALAALSKENGALLPLLLLIVDGLLLQSLVAPAPLERAYRRWRTVFVQLPLFVLAAGLLWLAPTLAESYALRDFSATERLLTQPRALWSYLGLIAWPRIVYDGPLYDSVAASTSLVSPWITLPALLALAATLVAAWRGRRAHPLVAAAILLFFAAHALESSLLPLELYFEHRSYLPAALPVVLLAVALAAVLARRPARLRAIGAVAGAAAAGVLLFLLSMRAGLWGDAGTLYDAWARHNPASLRIRQQAAAHHLASGDLAAARAHLDDAMRHHPDSALLALQRVSLDCARGATPALPEKLGRARLTPTLQRQLAALQADVLAGRCSSIDATAMQRLWRAALDSDAPRRPQVEQQARFRYGELLLVTGQGEAAVRELTESYALRPRIEAALFTAGLLATHGCRRAALALLERADGLPPPRLTTQGLGALGAWLRFPHAEIGSLARRIAVEAGGDRGACAAPAGPPATMAS